jgi:hypothetical protein
MLDRTRTRFADLSDEPCSGAHLLAPTDSKANYRHSVGSGAGPPLPANSMAALRSLAGSGATSQPQIIKDWRRRGGALVSAPCGTLGADAGGVELAFDERLFKESASGGRRWREEGSCSVGRLVRSSRRGGCLRPSEARGPPGAT